MEGKIKLLYAEDEESTRITYTQILSEQGFDVYATKDGDEAWEEMCIRDRSIAN